MGFRRFENGELGDVEKTNNYEEVTYIIVKYEYTDKLSFEGYRFFIGVKGDNNTIKKIHMITDNEISFDARYVEISRYVKLTNKDIINLKSGNCFITNSKGSDSNGIFFYDYNQIVRMLGKNIEFYK